MSIVAARTLVGGRAEGAVLALAPLSFWGGVDVESGRIVDRSHPARGERVTGRVLVMATGRGSSSSSSVLAETLRLGTGPAAIVMREADPIVVVGASVAHRLYGLACPIVVCAGEDFARVERATRVRVDADAGGSARIECG